MVTVLPLILPLALALIALVGRRALLAARLGAVVLAASAAVAAVGAGSAEPWQWQWIEALGLELHLELDGFGALMVVLVGGIGSLVLWYSTGYFPQHRAFRRFIALFLVFAASMNGLVMSADLFTMFVFWELTSVTSFLLIGMNDESAAARQAALRALLVTGAGGLCLLVSVGLFQVAAGTTGFAELATADSASPMFAAASMFALVGALTKSAQFPFHFWLPGAMSAPTPVSAYLHSATMVKAGIVLMARLAPAVDGVAAWRWSAVVLGGITMLLGGVRAMRQVDAKLLLAHSTVSQLGLMAVLVGLGNPLALYAGIAHLAAHAVFKVGLFLSVGIVDHSTGTRDIGELSGVGRKLPVVAALTAIGAASMAGVPPLLGFVTKEKVLAVLLDADGGLSAEQALSLAAVVVGSALSVAYSVRLVRGLFGSKPGRTATEIGHQPGPSLVWPMGAAVAVSLVAGLAAGPVGTWMKAAARSLDTAAAGKLVLWPGLVVPLAVSAVVLVVGGLGGVGVRWSMPRRALPFGGEQVFHALYEGLLRWSIAITRYTQSGSLVAYTAVVFVAVALALGIPAIGLIGDVRGEVVLADSAAQGAVAVLAMAFAVAAAAVGSRMAAALLAGGLGFACAALYALFGAPDLALTQVLVECLVMVVVLLLVRRLATRFDADRSWLPRLVRVAVAVVVGLSAAGFALAASLSRSAPSVGAEYLDRSAPEGAGNNVVNVILVDFRGADTLGEVTVLIVAGLGVANLLLHARRRRGGVGSSRGHVPASAGAAGGLLAEGEGR